MPKPTIDDVRAVLWAGHSKGRQDPEDALNKLWIKHIEARVERYGEAFVESAPRQLTAQNTSVTLEDWSTEDLRQLIQNPRTRPLMGDEDAPVVIVRYRGQTCLIDGGRRITKWAQESDPNAHKAYVVTIIEPSDK